MKLKERVAYLKGMMEGMGLDNSTNEAKALLAITDILDEMAGSIEGIQEELEEVTDLVEVIDEDLSDMEECLLGDDHEHCHNHEHCHCHCEDEDDDDDDDYVFDDDDELYEVTCPGCGDTICLDEDMLSEGAMDCPNCGKNLEFDFSTSLDLDTDSK